MANYCDFHITVKGDPQSLTLFEKLVMKNGYELIDTEVCIPLNDNEDGLSWIKLTEKAIQHLDNGDAYMVGWCNWIPPIQWLVNVSKQISGVSFLLNSTLEHEHYEEWSVSNGHGERTYTETINIQAGDEWKPIPAGQGRMTPD